MNTVTMKANELTGAALDWVVAKCEAWPLDIWYDEDQMPMIRDDEPQEYKPSTDWAQGGPIIEREKISLLTFGLVSWKATFDYGGSSTSDQYGPTPLIAAMRCYVASKLGDDVEIPADLA